MRILDLALKDIRQILRDRLTLLFLVVMPIVFTFFFGFIYSSPQSSEDDRLPVGVVVQDPDGALTPILIGMLESSQNVRPVQIGEPEAAQLDSKIVDGELSAALIIPAGFSAAHFNGDEAQLELVLNEETPNGQTVRRALQTILTRLMGMVETAQLSAKAYENQVGFADDAARQAFLLDAVQRGAQRWQQVSLSIQTASSDNQDAAGQAGLFGANPYNQFSPGMMVQFVIFGLIQAAMVMVLERKNGAMARLLTTPMTRAELIGGHILGMFIIFFAQQLLLAGFGQFFLKVDYLRQPAASLLVMAALALWVASLGLLISSLARKEEQVILGSMVSMFIFSALGGSWFSLEMVGETFATIAHLTPSAWAMDGFQNILIRGMGTGAVLMPVAVLLTYTLAFFGLAIWRFRVE